MTAAPERARSGLGTTAFRAAALAIALFVATSAGLGWLLVVHTNGIVTDQVVRGLQAELELLRAAGHTGGQAGLAEAVRLRSLPPPRGLYHLSDAAGHRIAGNLSRVPPEIDPSAGGIFRYAPDEVGGRGETLRLAAAVASEVDGGRLVVARDVEDQRALAERIRSILFWGYGLLLLVGLAGAVAAGRHVLKRVAGITETSRTIMAGDLSRRMPVSGEGDEFDDLSQSLNEMLERIEQLMGSLREVSDNIAHDLKTPLNRLRNKAEAALRDPRGTAAYREGLERTIEEADGLISTFNALLLIARLEAGAVDETAVAFDVSRLVADVAELYQPVAEEAGMALSVHAGQDIGIVANRQLVSQAVANLIDNAIKYAAPSGGADAASAPVALDVSVRAGPQGAELTVADRGPGIGLQDRERALKRFVRLDQSRSRPGTGLGLSLVAAVARLHRGTVRLEDNTPGLRVVLVLPYGERRNGGTGKGVDDGGGARGSSAIP